MLKKTPLHELHQKAGAILVDFAGWDMPVHYGSQIEEHQSVRGDAGMFDVSHMTVLDLNGEKSTDFLRYLLANDVAKLKSNGRALYTCMLNDQAGIIDDLIVYKVTDTFYRIVVNAGTRDKDVAWFLKQAEAFDVDVNERQDLSIIAVQGPNAVEKTQSILTEEQLNAVQGLKFFHAAFLNDWLFARTGYTGESGFEIILPNTEAVQIWEALLAAGVKPCGLGARDTLRLEAGLNLYGTDMDESQSPHTSNLMWTVSMTDRDFIGKSALEACPDNHDVLVGLVLLERGVLRGHQVVYTESGSQGETTSGTFSPTLKCGIAFARVPSDVGEECFVEVRGKRLRAKVIRVPFVKNGQANFEINQGEKTT